MPREQVCFKKRRRYKYTLAKDYSTTIKIKPQNAIDTGLIALTEDGKLTIKEGYAWDGPSGPMPDTKTSMRASLVHDVLYQLMREEHVETDNREAADEILRITDEFGEDLDEDVYEKIYDLSYAKLKSTLRPELLNRIDEIIVFKSLSKKDLKEIVKLLFRKVEERLEEHEMQTIMMESVENFLIEKGYSPSFGARPLKRTIEKYVTQPIANKILKGEFQCGDTVVVDMDFKKNKIRFYKKEENTKDSKDN